MPCFFHRFCNYYFSFSVTIKRQHCNRMIIIAMRSLKSKWMFNGKIIRNCVCFKHLFCNIKVAHSIMAAMVTHSLGLLIYESIKQSAKSMTIQSEFFSLSLLFTCLPSLFLFRTTISSRLNLTATVLPVNGRRSWHQWIRLRLYHHHTIRIINSKLLAQRLQFILFAWGAHNRGGENKKRECGRATPLPTDIRRGKLPIVLMVCHPLL